MVALFNPYLASSFGLTFPMTLRNNEIFEAIRRDDLPYLMCTRYESVLEFLIGSDLPEMLRYNVTPLMVAAYFGSFHCFSFLVRKGNADYIVPETKVSFLLTLSCHSLRRCWWESTNLQILWRRYKPAQSNGSKGRNSPQLRSKVQPC